MGFEAKLWATADKLRGNMEPSDYKHVALGLIFLKYISDAFEAKRAALLKDDYADPEDPEEYLAENVFWVPKEARWSYLQDNAKREAEALEAKWKLEAYRQRHWDEQPSRTFEELMAAYLKAIACKRSHDKDLQRTNHLRRFFGGKEIRALRPKEVRGYITARREEGVSDSTINWETALFSAAINYANTKWDWQLPNPVKGRKLREPEGRVRWITKGEATALIAAAEAEAKAPHLPDFIRLALNTGCRAGELLGLEWRRGSILRQGILP